MVEDFRVTAREPVESVMTTITPPLPTVREAVLRVPGSRSHEDGMPDQVIH